jgi:GNAT superfamily N-acetyltransferase
MEGATGANSADSRDPAISFRGYEEGDIAPCARLAQEAWPANPGVISSDSEVAGMHGYMEYSLGASNYTDFAVTGEEVAGFLFGRIDGYPGRPAPKRPALGEVPSIIASSMRHGSTAIGHLRFLWSLALTDLKLMLMTPRSDAVIEMFIVAKGQRGKGVGSALLERYLKAAKGAGASLVTVYTDERMSDWRFYERKGFRRVRTFHDNITSHYSGAYTRGLIYALDLRTKTETV